MSFAQDLAAIQSAFDQAQPHLAHLRNEWRITLVEAEAAGAADEEQWEDLALTTTEALPAVDASVAFLLEATRLAPGIIDLGLEPVWLGKLERLAAVFLAEGRHGGRNRDLLARLAAEVGN